MREQKSNCIRIYTLVETGVDADRGCFPSPSTMGSYLTLSRAQMELAALIAEKKETLDDRYNREERGDDHWEAFEEGYAAARFVRIDILPSELSLAPAAETKFSPANHLEDCAECHERYGTPCCSDEESDCGLLDEARQEFEDIAADDRVALSTCLGKLDTEFCSCPERRSKNPVEAFLYVNSHMAVERWVLQYTSLSGEEDRRLCRVGTCRVCGKALCEGSLLDAAYTTEEVFTQAWKLLKLAGRLTNHAALLAHPACAKNLFVSMFHEEDKPTARAWFQKQAEC